ncbi:site-specific integrase [Ignatzschineria rhizosphaerae]|uniref:Site-specific integrase n=1 Tax=Ignatzschineria rhizosphaerae TaxID=2923279 RepID=A0ABY3X5I9_9GAMM|nr:site-specific integrase [Ignatzschineria rhizosphaerae]UNM96045.1 site-specific integrase [Ignatzschineria rhizosphaerae]
MAYVKKRGNRWRVEVNVMINYEWFRDSKTFDTKAEATLWGIEREAEMKRGQVERPEDKTLRDALFHYLETEVPKKRTQRYIDNATYRIKSFLECPALNVDTKLHSLGYEVFDKYINYRLNVSGVVTSTVNKELTFMRSAIRLAQKMKWLDHNPFEHVQQLKEPPPRNRRISDDEISRILEALDYDEEKELTQVRHRVAVMFLFALETGMRISEICNLDWNNIFIKERYLRIPESKNDDSRDVPLSMRAIELLERMRFHSKNIEYNVEKRDQFGRKISYRAKPVFYNNSNGKAPGNASKLFSKYVDKIGIVDLTFHDTRHEACTRLARKIDVLDLAKMIGHRDIKSLMIYYNPTATEIAGRLG